LENFTNSLFLCSKACLAAGPGRYDATSLTASSNFLIALAISLKKKKYYKLIIALEKTSVLDSLQKGLPVSDFIGDPAENPLERC